MLSNIFKRIANLLSLRSRREKLDLFMREMSPTPQSCILDVGMAATPRYEERKTNILEREWPWKSQLIAISRDYPSVAKQHHPLVKMIQADGCQLPLANESVDYVWSNAVIEHVGDMEQQRAFVLEALRVAREGVFIATPDCAFPLEIHSNLPFIHWLPKRARDAIFNFLGFRWMNSISLLSEREFGELFPSGTEVRIIRQRITLLPYNLVALVRKP